MICKMKNVCSLSTPCAVLLIVHTMHLCDRKDIALKSRQKTLLTDSGCFQPDVSSRECGPGCLSVYLGIWVCPAMYVKSTRMIYMEIHILLTIIV